MLQITPCSRRSACSAAAMVALAAVVFVGPLRAQEPPSAITLEEAVRLAVRNDPAAVAAEAGISSARADLLQARGAFTPSLTLNSSYSNSSNSRFDQTSGQLVSESYTA